MPIKIDHEPDQSRFVAKMKGEEAELNYSKEGRVLNFLRVFVPPAFRGKGVAAKITAAGFEYAKANGFTVIPTCPYVRGAFLARYSEYRSLVQQGTGGQTQGGCHETA